MVKHCLLLLFLCGILNAQIAQNTQEVQNNQNLSQSNLAPLQNPVDYKVMQLLGGEAYRVNQKFIQRLFSNQGYFLDSTKNPDLYKIARTLKQNGLLKLKFAKPMELEVAFIIDENPQTFISTLYDCLNAMGYYYFLVKQSTLEDKQFKFVLSMNTEYAIDPSLFLERLSEYGYKASGIERASLTQWNYEIKTNGFKNAKATKLTLGESFQNANLKGEYFYEISGGTRLEAATSNGVLWYPKLVFFDSNLRILEIIKSQKALREGVWDIPRGAAFAKVSDSYLPINIKNGLRVILK